MRLFPHRIDIAENNLIFRKLAQLHFNEAKVIDLNKVKPLQNPKFRKKKRLHRTNLINGNIDNKLKNIATNLHQPQSNKKWSDLHRCNNLETITSCPEDTQYFAPTLPATLSVTHILKPVLSTHNSKHTKH